MTEEFTTISKSLQEEIPLATRQAEGIYFTPRTARDRLFQALAPLELQPTHILEPSCGSGEFVRDAHSHYPHAHITAVEKNLTIYEALAATPLPNTTLINADFISYSSDSESLPDLIIGNPPYFVSKTKNPACMTGRPNIYVEFIYSALTKHLSPGGVLAFILPTSLYNSSYYEPMRAYIYDNTTVLHLETLKNVPWADTAQDTMLLVLRLARETSRSNPKHAFFYCPVAPGAKASHYLSPHWAELEHLATAATTIAAVGGRVKTGEVVWNQHKEKLTDDPTQPDTTPILYSANIGKDHTMILDVIKDKKGEKKQYIKGFGKPPLSGPSLLINRGYGNVYKFDYAYVDLPAYYAENHVNVIHMPDPADYAKLEASLEDERTAEFIRYFVGNGGLSKTELETVLPLYGFE
jgi:adenine-specific DNA-methyltransferase